MTLSGCYLDFTPRDPVSVSGSAAPFELTLFHLFPGQCKGEFGSSEVFGNHSDQCNPGIRGFHFLVSALVLCLSDPIRILIGIHTSFFIFPHSLPHTTDSAA
jgi:hypothetical protein